MNNEHNKQEEHRKELWTPKILTREGVVRTNVLGGLRALDVGCGHRKLPGADGIDILPGAGIDVVHDLDQFPWPLESNIYDLVFANSVLEHVVDVMGTMREIHRVSKAGATVIIKVPYFRSTDAFADPTHYHYYTSRSFDFFVKGREFAHYGYADFFFTIEGFWYGWPHPSRNPLKRALKTLMHAYPDVYDQHWSQLVPVECVTWELSVVK
jgi:SAM-dependent methyltransferase